MTDLRDEYDGYITKKQGQTKAIEIGAEIYLEACAITQNGLAEVFGEAVRQARLAEERRKKKMEKEAKQKVKNIIKILVDTVKITLDISKIISLYAVDMHP